MGLKRSSPTLEINTFDWQKPQEHLSVISSILRIGSGVDFQICTN